MFEIDGDEKVAAVKYVNRRNIVAIDQEGGRIAAVMSNGDTVGMPEMPPSEAKLPYDAEVEYLESTGTQWIDTGIIPDASTVCAAEIMYTDTRTQQFGSGRVSGGLWAILFGYYQGHAHFWPGVSQPNINLNRNVNERFSCGFDIPLQKYAVDGVWTYNSTITPPTDVVQSFALFARKNSDTNYSSPCSMRLYSFSISASAKLISLIPVRVGSGSSAVGYLYDRANPDGGPLGNGLYGNAADGQGGVTGFPANCVGPDK